MRLLPLLTASAAALAAASGWAAIQGHEEGTSLTRPCTPCHRSHGQPDTPLLLDREEALCLRCHDQSALTTIGRNALGIVPSANPADIRGDLSELANHRSTSCAGCHTIHHAYTTVEGLSPIDVVGTPAQSPRKGFDTQAAMCLSCHTRADDRDEQSAAADIQRLVAQENRSYHPILATAVERSPSAPTGLQSAFLSCTDCHGNSRPGRPRGIHGSRVAGLLRNDYTTTDGQAESLEAYALCYACHDRGVVLRPATGLTLHATHVVDQKTSCATCHDGHGSIGRRALIRFGEEAVPRGVTPSVSTDRLEYVSDSAGSGACYLTCHGVDHGPLAYGRMKSLLELLDAGPAWPPSAARPVGRPDIDRR